MKIVHVTFLHYPEPRSGAPICCFGLAEALKPLNEVKIFCARFSSETVSPSQRTDIKNGMEVTTDILPLRIRSRRFYRYRNFYNPRCARLFSRYLKKEKPDIVHFHDLSWMGGSLVVEAKKMSIPIVATLHEGWWICPRLYFLKGDNKTICERRGLLSCTVCVTKEGEKGFFWARLAKNFIYVFLRGYYLKKVFRNIDRIIIPSHFLAEKYFDEGIAEEKAIISKNGIDLGLLRRDIIRTGLHEKPDWGASRKVQFIFLGGGSRDKGYELLINAVRGMKRNDFSLHLWGEYDAGSADKTVKDLKDKDIVFHGPYIRRDMANMFSQTDILIFPSLVQENCPLSVLEAFGLNVPVIGVNAGGVPELIKDGENGLLFRHNNPRDLSDKMETILDNPSLIGKMKDNIGKVKDIREQAIEIESIYKGLRVES